MSGDMHVRAFKPADEKWLAMKAAWDACVAAGADVPDKVERFFDGEEPDPQGVLVEEDELRRIGAITDWSEDMREGVEVNTAKLPTDVTVVRVYMGY